MTGTARARDEGAMSVEIVILVPILLVMLLLVVAAGRYTTAEGDVQAMARDAVRAATLERDPDAALASAQAVADATAPPSLNCRPVVLTGVFAAGEVVRVDVLCAVSFSGLGLLGLPGQADVRASSSAPLDSFRRTQG